MGEPRAVMQGCPPDCRYEVQGYPAPCEMYPEERCVGCAHESAREPLLDLVAELRAAVSGSRTTTEEPPQKDTRP